MSQTLEKEMNKDLWINEIIDETNRLYSERTEEKITPTTKFTEYMRKKDAVLFVDDVCASFNVDNYPPRYREVGTPLTLANFIARFKTKEQYGELVNDRVRSVYEGYGIASKVA